MKLERLDFIASKRDALFLGLFFLLLLAITLSIKYVQYREFVRFSDTEVDATVVKQYLKDADKPYSVLRYRLPNGVEFSSRESAALRSLLGYQVTLRVFPKSLGFLDYLRGFYASSYILHVFPARALRFTLLDSVIVQHENREPGLLYGALFLGTPLPKTLREKISALGISHLVAISGFHLGVLSFVLYLLFRPPYRILTDRIAPYRSVNRDLFFFIAAVLLAYVVMLDYMPSLVRAYTMMVIGFVLYERGYNIVSVQTLCLTVLFVIALFPPLFFKTGFWLSVAGVYYIFVILKHFGHLKPWKVFILVTVWVYFMMLPFSLYLFGTFSLVHVVSILYSMLFLLFYPLAMLLHLVGEGAVLDSVISGLLQSGSATVTGTVTTPVMLVFLALSLAAYTRRLFLGILGVSALFIYIAAVYDVAHL